MTCHGLIMFSFSIWIQATSTGRNNGTVPLDPCSSVEIRGSEHYRYESDWMELLIE